MGCSRGGQYYRGRYCLGNVLWRSAAPRDGMGVCSQLGGDTIPYSAIHCSATISNCCAGTVLEAWNYLIAHEMGDRQHSPRFRPHMGGRWESQWISPDNRGSTTVLAQHNGERISLRKPTVSPITKASKRSPALHVDEIAFWETSPCPCKQCHFSI